MPAPLPHAEALSAAWQHAVRRVTDAAVPHTAVPHTAAPHTAAPHTAAPHTAAPHAEPANADAARVEAPLEAACLAIVLEVTGALAGIPGHERALVRDAARRAILTAMPAPRGAATARTSTTEPLDASAAAQGAGSAGHTGRALDDDGTDGDPSGPHDNDEGNDDDDDEADDARRILVALAREGVRVLAGGAAPASSAAGTAHGAVEWHPSPAGLVAMMRGGPDPVAAGGVAAHVVRCATCRAALQVLAHGDATVTHLRAAAASAPAMLAPQAGRLVAARAAPDAEAFVFEGDGETRLAVYVGAPLAVRYLAEGVTTDDMRPGYWAGRCAPGTTHVDGTLHVGEEASDWPLTLTARPPAR